MTKLKDKELAGVSGGLQSNPIDTKKRSAFEEAWGSLGTQVSEVSNMKKAEIFDEWELAGFTGSSDIRSIASFITTRI